MPLHFAIACTLACTTAAAAPQAARDYPYVPVPFESVKIDGGFWSPRIETNRKVTVWYDFQKCEETGRIDNFAKAGGLISGEFRGIPYDDSDVFKVIEGAAYSLAVAPDAKLDRYLDDLIAKIAAAQEPDGYLYTARTIDPQARADFHGPERWSNLRVSHELYNVGHMYEAAVAHYQATGKRSLLDVAIRNADLLTKTFGPGNDQLKEPPGHQEIEIGLAKLYRATGNSKYLELAKFFLDERGRPNGRELRGPYQQDHEPVVEQDEAVGHAVRAGYMYSGMADVAALTGDKAFIDAIDRIWENVVSKKLYLTGGLGARHAGEAFGDDYELPNESAYNETCAAIAGALWNQRMFQLHGDAKYVDVLERTVYNGFLSGVSLSGDRFFYPNPLACDGRRKFNHGSMSRSPWFGTSCCPVNVVRFIPSIAGYVYARRGDALYTNLFVGGEGTVELPGGKVRVRQETDYPWSGHVKLTLEPDQAREFALHVRIPGWTRGRPVPSDLYRYVSGEPAEWSVAVNGEQQSVELEKGYAVLRRKWQPGDTVQLELPMPIRRVVAHDQVAADRGRVAIERGPMVYCVEAVDHGGRVMTLALPDGIELTAEHRPDFLGGVTVITGQVPAVEHDEEGRRTTKAERLTMIPYYAWAHRELGEMAVWLPREVDSIPTPPRPTLASRSTASASHVFAHDTVDAVNDQAEPRNSGDGSIPRLTWWDHKGTTEWVQYDFPQPAKVSAVEVYWFDDTGRGGCRVPQSWQVLYRDGDHWRPVQPAGNQLAVKAVGKTAAEKDKFQVLEFTPVATDGLRLEVQLQPGYSAGILEWKVR